ncbi:hypothetical protein SAMN05421823_102678 [Catalinimonas alkaloidigena]|uniref:Uncharacterized protein n=2 Tax=Catalinimonas alkaloidigena TaxID=1075417 RepID=A0A1G9BPY5_9BACT|nr:hypothetical protein SAMN05421823_102678 [Catalinimonas alkaloidigena]
MLATEAITDSEAESDCDFTSRGVAPFFYHPAVGQTSLSTSALASRTPRPRLPRYLLFHRFRI